MGKEVCKGFKPVSCRRRNNQNLFPLPPDDVLYLLDPCPVSESGCLNRSPLLFPYLFFAHLLTHMTCNQSNNKVILTYRKQVSGLLMVLLSAHFSTLSQGRQNRLKLAQSLSPSRSTL